jgi:putative FmdB family regulatory protein
MPTYDYLCLSCGKKFSAHMTIGNHDKHKVKCPKCGSRKLQQRVEQFVAITAKKS